MKYIHATHTDAHTGRQTHKIIMELRKFYCLMMQLLWQHNTAVEKNQPQWLKWQATLTWVWMRRTLRSSWKWFLNNWLTEHVCITEERAREKATAEGKRRTPRKFTEKGLVEDFKTLRSSLKSLRTWTPKQVFTDSKIQGALSAYKQVCD